MESVLRGATIYVFLLLITRLSGRRTLAQMTPFDFVLLLIVAETTQQALLGDDFSIVNAVALITVLFTIDIGLSYIKELLPPLALVLDGSPTVLVSNGKPDWRAMRRARIGVDDILSSARELQGLERLDQIKFAILESNGGISIVPAEKS